MNSCIVFNQSIKQFVTLLEVVCAVEYHYCYHMIININILRLVYIRGM